MKILIINGPNLDLLHLRDNNIYGGMSLSDINRKIEQEFPDIEFDFVQSASEEEIIHKIHGSRGIYEGIVINPGALSHSSIAIRDAIEFSSIPVVEVHLSNLSDREKFRNVMLTASKCAGYISGFKETGYLIAVYSIMKIIQK